LTTSFNSRRPSRSAC